MKKAKKNPTFNEYFPQQFIGEEASFEYMFDYVFIDEKLQRKIIELFTSSPMGSAPADNLKLSFEFSFRNEQGEREVDNAISNGVFSQAFNENQRYDYLSTLLNRYQYKWGKLIDNVYAQTYNPLENYDRQEDTSLTYEGSENVTRNVDSGAGIPTEKRLLQYGV